MKDKKVILYIVLCILIVCMITGLIYLKVNHKEDNKVENTGSNETVNSKDKVLALIDVITVKDALESIYNGSNYTAETLSKNYILKSTLNSINNDKTFTTDDLKEVGARLKICVNSGYYTEDYVMKNIEKVYGKVEFDYSKDIANTGFSYDSTKKNFYELCNNKIESTDFFDTYVYDYKEENDKAYVYISVAYGKEVPVMANGGATNKTTVNIYRNAKRDDLYKSYVVDPTTKDQFNLSADNYKEFTKFKYTFTKTNGEFHFTSIEVIPN
jgi:hypothetical protein